MSADAVTSFTLTPSVLASGATGVDELHDIERADITGGPSDNFIQAAPFTGDTTISEGGGNDSLDGGTGSDTMIGGAGKDRYEVRDGEVDYLFVDDHDKKAKTDPFDLVIEL